MGYQGHRTNILPMGQRTATSNVSGSMNAEDVTGCIFVIDVKARVSGSITDLKVRIRATSGRNEGTASDYIIVYTFAALAIAAKGVYAMIIYPGGTAGAAGWTKAPLDGPIPSEFQVEIVEAGGSDLTYQVDAMWL